MLKSDRFLQKQPLFSCVSLRGAVNRRTFALAIGTQADRYAPHLPERHDAAEVGKPRLRLLIEMIS